jgi:hypothetical protein
MTFIKAAALTDFVVSPDGSTISLNVTDEDSRWQTCEAIRFWQ